MRRYLAVLIAVCIVFVYAMPALAQQVPGGAETGEVAEDVPEMTEDEIVEEPADEIVDEPVYDETVDESMQDFMSRSHEWLDQNRILGKIIFRPYVMTSIVFDDNIYMNAKDEPNTLGRVDDFIWDSTVKLHLILPTNPTYTKVFKRKEMMILGYDFNAQYYFENGDTNSVNNYLWTDLFSFFTDMFNQNISRNGFYGKLRAEWSDVSDPIDILLRDLNSPGGGFPVTDELLKVSRQAVDVDAAVGWKGNRFDAELGYVFYWLSFDQSAYEQANQMQNTGILEVGYTIPNTQDLRVYLRGSYMSLRFDEPLLNDANVQNYVVGGEGIAISKKIRFVGEFGWLLWDHDDSGATGDDSDYNNATYLLRLIYRPIENRNLRIQLEASQEVNWSVISNYRLDRPNTLTIFDELIKNRLDGDITVAYSYHRPSEGPIRRLWELGAGVTYHPWSRVDVTLRYLYRNQQGDNEITLNTEDAFGDPFTLQTDSSFYQNVLQLAIAFQF